MEDSLYKYPVALKWTEGPGSLKQLRNKLLLYFQSKNKSNGGECHIRDLDCSREHVLIHFRDEAAWARVLQKETHELQLPGGKKLNLEVSSVDSEKGGKVKEASTVSAAMLSETSTRLNTDLIPREISQEVKHKPPSLKMAESEDGVKVRGSYRTREKLSKFPQMKFKSKVRRSANDEEHGEERGEDKLNLQTALYENIAEAYREEMAKIENRFNVEVTEVRKSKDATYIKLKPLGPNSSEKRARQIFIDQVEDVTKDWHQKKEPISGMKAPSEDTKQCMKEQPKTFVIEDGGRLVLRGPERELTLTVEALQKEKGRAWSPQRIVTISFKDTRSEVLVDTRYMDILKKLKSKEIEELQKKYRVRMDEEGKDGNVIVSFTAMNGAPELGAQACESLTNLLQSTIKNLQRKPNDGNLDVEAERLAQFNVKQQKGGVDIILGHDKGSGTPIASPILVDLDEGKLRLFFKIQDAPKAAVSRGGTDEVMDCSNSPDTKASAEEEKCPICLDQIKNKKVLEKCKHEFCDICIQKCFVIKPVCPLCSVPYGVVLGNQPNGTMGYAIDKQSLPGFPGCGSIQIYYTFPGGIQQKNHPNPGKPYSGTGRIAYLPHNKEGNEILHLLRKAFDQKLIFTVAMTGAIGTVTWNDIHHKTSTYGGGPTGYPDPSYLKRVREELKAKGIE